MAGASQGLFGGETVHFPKLSDEQRAAKQAELKELLRRMDVAAMMLTGRREHNLGDRVALAIRSWLDSQVPRIPDDYAGGDAAKLRQAAIGFFRAHEILGDKKYLEAGLTWPIAFSESSFPGDTGPMATRETT
ncbi:MAG: hypothetical protein Ct9H300mP1_13710 [Planctomycetaceae bacterium]|nr:MAG: hypothetical protein Ct9H300mP1_13710 [Planctomycetaceae bacterium]